MPLFASDRAVGVFMVASVGKVLPLSQYEVIASQALAHSIASAVEDAHLFDTIAHHADSMGGTLDVRLRSLSARGEGDSLSPSDRKRLAGELGARVRQRLKLLELRDEVLAEESPGMVVSRAIISAEPLLGEAPLLDSDANPPEGTTARQSDSELAHVLDLGIGPALDYLARESGSGPSPERISVADSAQMVDADTTFSECSATAWGRLRQVFSCV